MKSLLYRAISAITEKILNKYFQGYKSDLEEVQKRLAALEQRPAVLVYPTPIQTLPPVNVEWKGVQFTGTCDICRGSLPCYKTHVIC